MCHLILGLTAGIAAPLIAVGAGAIVGGVGAAGLGTVAGAAIIGSIFGVAGAGLTGLSAVHTLTISPFGLHFLLKCLRFFHVIYANFVIFHFLNIFDYKFHPRVV